jgi:trans-aconitate methyltransferase
MESETPSKSPGGPTAWDAALYDERHAFVWKAGSDLLDLLNPQPGERILDLGCGTGHLTAGIAERGAEVVGTDASAEMVAAARDAYPAMTFLVMRGEELTCDAPFDAVFSNAALHWMPEADAVAENIARALKPGGRLVAEFGGKGNVHHVTEALLAALRAEAPDTAPSLPWYFPSVGEYAALLERHGLEVTFAALFDRPTPLDGEDGLRAWFRMFADGVLAALPAERRAPVLARAEAACRPNLYRDGTWVADYRRLRVVAKKLEVG